MTQLFAEDAEYIAALAAAKARPNQATMMRVHTALSKHHDAHPAESDRLWREALDLLNDPRFGEK